MTMRIRTSPAGIIWRRAGAGLLAAGIGRAAGVCAQDDYPPGLPDQHVGHAHLLSAALRSARKARDQVRGVRGAVRQSHHAADGGAAGRHGHLCRSVLHPSATTRAAWSAIAMIENVGKTARVMARKDLNITKVEQLKGLEDRQPDRLLDRQHLRRSDRDHGRPEEGRLSGSPHERERHGGRNGRQDRGRHGQCRALQRHRRSRRHRQHRSSDFSTTSTRCRCSWRRRRNSSRKIRQPWLPISRPGSKWRSDFKEQPEEGRRHDLYVLHVQGLQDGARDLRARRSRASRSIPAFRPILQPYMHDHAEILLKEKKIKAIPDWSKALPPGVHGKGQGLTTHSVTTPGRRLILTAASHLPLPREFLRVGRG